MGRSFNINTDEAVVYTNKLEKLHRSALPVAIRGTLNSAAFDVKQKTIPLVTQTTFEERRKNFFKAKSRVIMARGFNIRSMSSQVGFFGAENNQAVENLEKQERGGLIPGRTFIPMDTARVGKSHSRNISGRNKLKNIRAIDRINAKKDFARKVNKAGVGGHIIYKGTLFSVQSTERGKIKLKPLYSFDKGRSAKITKATRFMRKATTISVSKMNSFYIKEATKQIKRLKLK